MNKGIIFDMDGVLVDSEPVYISRAIEYINYMGYSATPEQLRITSGNTPETEWNIISEIFNGEISFEEYKRSSQKFFNSNPLDYRIILFSDVVPTLEWLYKKGIPIGLASNSCPEDIASAVELCGIKDYFSYIISGHDLPKAKPDPMIYLLAASKIGALPQECVVVEDSPYGISAARSAGISVVLARKDNYFGFNQSNADQIITNLSAVKAYF